MLPHEQTKNKQKQTNKTDNLRLHVGSVLVTTLIKTSLCYCQCQFGLWKNSCLEINLNKSALFACLLPFVSPQKPKKINMKNDNWKKILPRKNEMLSVPRLFISFRRSQSCAWKVITVDWKLREGKKGYTFIQNGYHVGSHDATRNLKTIKRSDWLSVFLPSNHLLPCLTFSFLFINNHN